MNAETFGPLPVGGPGPLTPVGERGVHAVARLAEIGRQVSEAILDGGGHWRPARLRPAALALVERTRDDERTIRAWATLLVLESPQVRGPLRMALLRELTRRGVYRDLSDLPEVGTCGVGGLLMAAALQDPGASGVLADLIACSLGAGAGRQATTADATLLGLVLRPEDVAAILRLASERAPLSEPYTLAFWISSLDRGGVAYPPPDSPLVRAWFETRAYRGARRLWARRRGLAAGYAGATALEPWLSWAGDRLPESYGSMVVEWTLAAARAWPDRQELARDGAPELGERAEVLGGQAAAVLGRCADVLALSKWLTDGLRRLLEAPEQDRRLLPVRRRSNPFGFSR